MGTRNLTMVISDGETKVAQYGQCDGYPAGVGSSILTFLKAADLDKFKEQLKSIKWLTEEQVDMVDATENWTDHYPYLSRDTADKILGAIHYGKLSIRYGINKKREVQVEILGLQDNSSFGGDSLSCEWAYVIDLDNMKFEVYEGFNKEHVPETNRFYGMDETASEYRPVKLIQTFDINNLPDTNEFIEKTDPAEKEA